MRCFLCGRLTLWAGGRVVVRHSEGESRLRLCSTCSRKLEADVAERKQFTSDSDTSYSERHEE